MYDARSSSAVYRLDGDSLAICPCHPSDPEGSMRLSIHLGESLMALKDELARLEVEQERGHFPPILMTACKRTYALFALTHPSSPQFLQPQYLPEERLLVEPFLAWGGLFRERHRWDDDARQKRIASCGHGEGGYTSRSGNREAKEHERGAHMVGPECIHPLGQASANRILNSADDALYLTIALAVASRRLLMDDSEHLA